MDAFRELYMVPPLILLRALFHSSEHLRNSGPYPYHHAMSLNYNVTNYTAMATGQHHLLKKIVVSGNMVESLLTANKWTLFLSKINIACCLITFTLMWMRVRFYHMVHRPSKKKRKKAIYWSLMIIFLIADRSNTIKAEGSVVICQSKRGRHVRVIKWAQWGACRLTRVNILCESLPPTLSLAMSVWLKEYSGVTVYLFCQASSLLCKVKNTKLPLRPILKTMYNLFESCENKTAHTQQKYFRSRGEGMDRLSKTMWEKENKFFCRLKIYLTTLRRLWKLVGNCYSPGSLKLN